ncbi:MAG: orotidine-5'-phosphate decarboxylase [Thermoplasmata archaeon]
MKRDKRLILALDVTSREEALGIAEEVSECVDAIKVGYPLALSCGMQMVTDLAGIQDVICDFKVADIPNTNRLIVEQVFAHGASGVIVHGFVGEDSVRACVEAAKGEVFVLSEMSHPGGQVFTAPIADRLAQLAVDVGASGIVAPATRPERVAKLREIVGDLIIITPGVGAQGGSASASIEAGADYIIVGRSIYNSPTPKETAKNIVEEIQSVRGFLG